MRIKIIIIVFMVCLLQCSETNIYQVHENNYVKMKSFFKSSFLDHFPSTVSTIDTLCYMEAVYDKNTENIMFSLSFKINEIDKKELIDSLKNISKEVIESTDTCALILNRFHTKENRFRDYMPTKSDRLVINRECYKNKLPIPNFYSSQFSSGETDYNLPKDFVVFVLDAKSGKYWDDKYLFGGYYMPGKWQNGYSKGIAVSRENSIVIYWFIIW